MTPHPLDEAMKSLAARNAATPAPAELEAKVLAAFDARRAHRPRWWWPAAAVTVAASCTLGIFLLQRPAPLPKPLPEPFTAIPYVAPPAPYERTEVRRMDVPLAALVAAGLEFRTTHSRGTVQADVLLGQDGRPLAIRLVKNTI